MFSAARTAPLTRNGPRPQPIAVSLVAHAGVLSLVVFGPPPGASGRHRSLYEQVIKPREHELVWYSFRQKLPEVSSPEMAPQAAGAELMNRDQTILSNPKQAERGAQMIWKPAPSVKLQAELTSPNILAFRLPMIPPPAPGPPRKLFEPPKVGPRKAAEASISLPAPPKIQELKQGAALAASLAAAIENRPKPRDFVPPSPKPVRRAAVQALPEAPRIATALRSDRVPLLAENMAAPLANKPQPRAFVAPAARTAVAVTPVPLPDAPRIATEAANGARHNRAIPGVFAAAVASPPKPREFVAPAPSGGGPLSNGSAAAPLLEDAPTVNAAGMPSANVNVAVVGLNPAARLLGPLPDSARQAKFSAGPNANGNAGGDGLPARSALSVPGLLIHGDANPQGAPSPNPLLIARMAPTSREALEAAAKAAAKAQAGGTMTPDPPTAEIHLAPPPDPQFEGRDVYSLAVQMPNITSYVGSWIMWFAERTPQGPRGIGGLRPPVPLHKVDPKYQPAAISERVEGKVQLAGVIRVDGHVDLLRVLKSVDPRLDQSAEQALGKWEFEPARRNGSPVEVDVVAEIPFLLAPQVKR